MSQINSSPPPADGNAVLAQLQALLTRTAAAPAGGMAAPLPMGFAAQAQAMPAATSVLIPLKIPVGQGSVKVHLAFGPEFADPNNLMALLTLLNNAGFPVDVYVPKQPGWNNGGGGYGNRGGGGGYGGNGGGGGYGGNGGGYNGGGGGGMRWGSR